MSAFERFAAQQVLDKAAGLGVPVPAELTRMCQEVTCAGANLYDGAHPDDDDPTVPDELRYCCAGAVHRGLRGCTCWTAVFDVTQSTPIPPSSAADLAAQPRMCSDCAFRKGSPERSTAYEEEGLFALADRGEPFWCHDGMRRPVRWDHPAGVSIPGDPADWQPPMHAGVPYRADGRPGLLCAGWAARAARAQASS